MLEKDPTKRISPEVVKRYPFFAPIDFDKLSRKELSAPYKPKVVSPDSN